MKEEAARRLKVSLVFHKEALLGEEAGCQLAAERWCYFSDSETNLVGILKFRFQYHSNETFFPFLRY